MQLQFKKQQIIYTILLCFSTISFPLNSQALTVQEVPNPRQVNNTWVTDKANILSDNTETQINQMISDLEAKNGSEIAVVTVPETKPAPTPKAFATKLFNFWKIGKKGKNNGVLFLISAGERRIEIETGSGIQSILPDTKVVGIIQTEITPKFKKQDFNGGTLAGTKALVNVLQNQTRKTQFQSPLPLAPIVPDQSVKPSPTPTQSPVISNSTSTGENSSNAINGLLPWFILFLILGGLGLFIAFRLLFAIFSIFRRLFLRTSSSPSPRHYQGNYSSNNRNYSSNSANYSSNSGNYCDEGGDYSTNSSDYSSNSSSDDCGGDSSGGGAGDDYSTNNSDDCGGDDTSTNSSDSEGSFGGGDSSGGGAGGDYSSSSSDSSGGGGDYSSSSSDSSGGGGDYSSSSSDSSGGGGDYSSSSSDSSGGGGDYSSSSSDYSSSSSNSDSSGGGGDW
jgi:uncharacterized protein